MQKNMDDWSNNPDSPPRKKSRTRTRFARFLFGVLGSVLLVAVAAATMVPKLTYRLPTQAHSGQSSTGGHAKLKLDPNTQTLTIQANISGAPSNTPLVMHVHGEGSCTGSMLFTLQATSDGRGHASTTMTFDDQQDTTIPSDWFFNVHDDTGNALSIACGPIQVD
ncbi:MAG TPA: CHRD domain-containing protein, partial [Ktedonobacteraceae bacterium]|nr:CHRD domain-containing protein [Ktedonobacteraceae bacterium]